MRCEHCDCGPDRHPPSSPCCYCGDDWNWPHLLARVLYVPGMCAAIGQREWYAGVVAALASEGDPEYGWSKLVPPDGWPS